MSNQPHVVKAWPDGHYYSPIPDLDAVRADEGRIFGERDTIPGVALELTRQEALLPRLAREAAEAPFATPEGARTTRYKYDNDFFGAGDALAWFGLLRLWRPRRVIEVGSGWSSAVLLDAIDCTPDWTPEVHFVEPYPERLHSLLRDSDDVHIVEEPAQSLEPSFFSQLERGDVLFIDSTHVSRVGSDVNYLLLEVLPRLAAGVRVHVHDIHFPFEYPSEWVYEGRAWNEAYVLRALLTDSSGFRILWWNSMLATLRPKAVGAAMPRWSTNPGASIYLERR